MANVDCRFRLLTDSGLVAGGGPFAVLCLVHTQVREGLGEAAEISFAVGRRCGLATFRTKARVFAATRRCPARGCHNLRIRTASVCRCLSARLAGPRLLRW